MNKLKLTVKLLLIGLFVSLTAYAQDQKVKNIILLIGDGMGVAQIYAGMASSPVPLNFERFTTVGFSKTYSANDFTTDSAAGGTALACGVKTDNGMIGVSPDSTAVNSIMQFAEMGGLSTGLVVACNVTHATPAAFVAHQPSRKMTQEIAADYLNSGIDVFIGGGRNDFEKRKDGRNLSDELRAKNYQVVYNQKDMQAVQSGKLAALVADNHPDKAAKRDNLLENGTKKALELLKQNDNGFFLMVEGSQIDWAGHAKQSDYLVGEVLDFDKAIGIALDFADKNPGTLVIVTADHETGGLTLPEGNIAKRSFKAKFSTIRHTGVLVPIFSYGTGSEIFGGIMQNTDVFDKMLRLCQF
jgi:alkaline phosphatase